MLQLRLPCTAAPTAQPSQQQEQEQEHHHHHQRFQVLRQLPDPQPHTPVSPAAPPAAETCRTSAEQRPEVRSRAGLPALALSGPSGPAAPTPFPACTTPTSTHDVFGRASECVALSDCAHFRRWIAVIPHNQSHRHIGTSHIGTLAHRILAHGTAAHRRLAHRHVMAHWHMAHWYIGTLTQDKDLGWFLTAGLVYTFL